MKIMTYQQKQQLIKKSKREQEKLMNKKFKEQKKKEDEEKKRYKIYPPIISTMLKRLRRIDPFSGICSWDNQFDQALVVYFKFRQKKLII